MARMKMCCARGGRKKLNTDFCSALKISSGVTLVERANGWGMVINHNGKKKDLETALSTHKCQSRGAGLKLAQSVLLAMKKAPTSVLLAKKNRQIPLILMKDYLFKAVGPCSSCKGRGCSACNGMGI